MFKSFDKSSGVSLRSNKVCLSLPQPPHLGQEGLVGISTFLGLVPCTHTWVKRVWWALARSLVLSPAPTLGLRGSGGR